MPYTCELCSSVFSHATNLKLHTRIHTGEKPFKCEECGVSFSQIGNLKRHLVYHSGLKQFMCDLCGVSFAEKGSLKRHLTTHVQREKLYKCDDCGDSFLHQSTWKSHCQRGHQGSFKWRDASIRLLLTLVKGKKAYRPLHIKKKRELWEAIAAEMSDKGYDLNREGVSKKWTNLLTMHKRLTDRHHKAGNQSTSWPYYEIIDEMLHGVTMSVPAVEQDGMLEETRGPFVWTDASVTTLLTLVEAKKAHRPLKKRKQKREMWKSVAEGMSEKGYINLPWEQVSKKWANLVDTHKRITDRLKKSGSEDTTWSYYENIDKMLKDRFSVQPQQPIVLRLRRSSTMLTKTSLETKSSSSQSSDDDSGEFATHGTYSIDPATTPTDDEVIPKRKNPCQRTCQRKKVAKTDEELMLPAARTASARFAEYCERKEKSEKKWRADFRALMAERNSTVQNLTNALSGLIQSQIALSN